MLAVLFGDAASDRVVPSTGTAARLTIFASAAMAFLAVFALALSLAAGRVAARWSEDLARSSTIRVAAPLAEMDAQVDAVLAALAQTPGVASARALSLEEQRDLLAPWFGSDMPLEFLPLPRIIDVTETAEGYDVEGLRLRLEAEAPDAVLDNHDTWRRALISAAGRLRMMGYLALALIFAATVAMVSLAALAANVQVIRVLRLVGARDAYIAGAFVRRFALRSLIGGGCGAALGIGALLVFPNQASAQSFMVGLSFSGLEWLLPLIIPVMIAFVSFQATKAAAFRTLRGMP
ncbi:MAG: cell division protein FtsX [Rhodobacteraceae bacterium]|jgi:cell division transport system permease protein|nr:cell division protein FtsX [Paracoccaceae bacterium]QPI86760.1 cell division protein FtsX [Rhodobacterales bacterium HKCCA1288]